MRQPVVGVEGGSYGGSITLAVSAFDRRVKAIVPEATWNDLRYSLDPNGVPKQGFLAGLYALGLALGTESHTKSDTGPTDTEPIRYDPEIHYAFVTSAAQGYVDPSVLSWFGQRSLAVYGTGPAGAVPDVPTLLMQGTEDTLFDLNSAWGNAEQISAAHPGLPVNVLVGCAGHTGCPDYVTKSTATSPLWPKTEVADVVENQMIDWLAHYLRGDGTTDGMPAPFVYQDQHGDYRRVATVPTVAHRGPATIVSAPFAGTLLVSPVPAPPMESGTGAIFLDTPTSADDPAQVTVPVLTAPANQTLPIVGIGHATFTANVSGQTANLFFRLIDKRTGGLIDGMTEPIRLDNGTSPSPHHVSLDLDGVSYNLPPGDTLELQVSTSSSEFMGNRVPGIVTLTNGTVLVPVLRSRP